jgi:hypothetical protein
MEKLKRFMDDHKAINECNITSMTGGKWFIPDNRLDDFNLYFLNIVTNHIFQYLIFN